MIQFTHPVIASSSPADAKAAQVVPLAPSRVFVRLCWSEHLETAMSTKRLRLSIDFHIIIADTPPLLPPGTVEPPDPEYDGRQARLLEAVRNNPQVLTRWMHDLIAQEMFIHASHYWQDMIMGGEIAFQDILAPAVATFSEEDQEFFNEEIRFGLFGEFIDMFQKSFTVKEDPPVVVELGGEA